MQGPIFTIGHSNHPPERLAELLHEHGATRIVDVRRFPGSRRHPHFDRESLERWLPEHGVEYRHLVDLGGRRTSAEGSPNGGWRVAAFRAYADHMATPEFCAALDELGVLAEGRPSAVMCSEGLWWRCHRRLISDALLLRGWVVRHVTPDGRAADHQLTAFAVADREGLRYPPEQLELES